MLVFCFRGHTFVVYLRTTKVHNNSIFKELTLHFLLPKFPHAFGFPIVNTPLPSEFHNREPPLPFGNPKSRPWYSMDIFWNRPIKFYVMFYVRRLLGDGFLAVVKKSRETCPSTVFSTFDMEQSAKIH